MRVVLFILLVTAAFPCRAGLSDKTSEVCDLSLFDKAQASNVAAQTQLGWCYSSGEGFEHDLKKAFHWYSKAAIAGSPVAQNNLGAMLLNGEPYTKNELLAAQWFLQAAMQGNLRAQYNLATMYRSGQGVAQNNKEALRWYTEAAYQNDLRSMQALAFMYRHGMGIDGPDLAKAAYWDNHAVLRAKRGDAYKE